MWWRRVERLARLARRRHPDGTLTLQAARAWERLTEDSHRIGISFLRDLWLSDPREDTWEYVSDWLTPRDLFKAAVEPARAAESRAAIGSYCVRHGLAPEYPVDRVVFYLLTGDQERYQAADPDGTLLARGYRLASEATREALRHTMIGAGELDLVRVVTSRPDPELTNAEADYLARQLADAGEWARLWRLMPTMPLAEAARAARRFPDWRPYDDTGRAFFARLAAVDPDTLAAPSAAAVTRIKTRHRHGFSFAPDGAEIAVRHDGGTKVFALPSGRLLENYAARQQLYMLALGDGTIVYTGDPDTGYPFVRRVPGRPAENLLVDVPGARVGRTPDGFVVVKDRIAYFGTARGPWSRTISASLPIVSEAASMSMVAADPVSGNLAFSAFDGGRRDLVLVDADLQVLASTPGDGLLEGAFCGPERIVLWQWGEGRSMELWQRDGTDLVQAAKIDLTTYMTPVVARDRVVIRGRGGLVWLDAATLNPVGRPPGLPWPDSTTVALSVDGSLAAVPTENGIEVHDLWLHQLPDLTGWRLSQAHPADLDTVVRLENRGVHPQVREVVALLRAALDYRFGTEVALGDGTYATGDAHDIALGDR